MKWAILLAALAIGYGTAAAEVTVTRKPVDVIRKTFDPNHRPANMPPLKGDEAAVTQTEFDCGVAINYAILSRHQQGGHCVTNLQVQNVHVTLQLKITIWLPKGASEKLTAHEEGHRQIAERVYEGAESAARELAGKLDGATLQGQGASCQVAEQTAAKSAQDDFCRDYLDKTGKRASRVNDLYDDITAHGTKAEPGEDEAIREAFKRDEEK